MFGINKPLTICGKTYEINRDFTGKSRQEFEGKKYIVSYTYKTSVYASIIFTGTLKECRKYLNDLIKEYTKGA